jgi:hypothetical protein
MRLTAPATSEKAIVSGEFQPDVFLPVEISGVRDDEMLRPDLPRVRITTASGAVFKPEYAGGLERAQQHKSVAHQLLWVPEETWQRIKDETVTVEIDYLLTLLHGGQTHAMAALNGDQQTDETGRCRTGVNVAGTAIQWRCSKPGVAPPCRTAFLENPQTGRRNQESSECGDYLPYKGQTLFEDAMTRFGGTLPYRVPAGLGQYPVDGSQLRAARVVFRVFQPESHFERKLVVDHVRLGDWQVE